MYTVVSPLAAKIKAKTTYPCSRLTRRLNQWTLSASFLRLIHGMLVRNVKRSKGMSSDRREMQRKLEVKCFNQQPAMQLVLHEGAAYICVKRSCELQGKGSITHIYCFSRFYVKDGVQPAIGWLHRLAQVVGVWSRHRFFFHSLRRVLHTIVECIWLLAWSMRGLALVLGAWHSAGVTVLVSTGFALNAGIPHPNE